MTTWADWWFLNGGAIHPAFKYCRYTELKRIALELPKIAWDEQQKEIDSLRKRLELAEAVCLEADNFLEDFLHKKTCVPGALARCLQAWHASKEKG